MNRKLVRSTIAAVAALLLSIAVAFAGGWSIITVHDLPDYAIAGKPVTLTLSVRQHGNNLLEGLRPKLRATTPQGREVKAAATAGKGSGEYMATLTFPEPGEWVIRIDGGFNPDDKTRAYNAITLLPLKVVRNETEAPAMSNSVRGERLFVAKGCVGCHNPEGKLDLSQRKLETAYLKMFLANPAIRTTDMPNLNLKQDEIAALSAFLTGAR